VQQYASSEEWFHVTHRGVGRRPVLPAATDIRKFLGLLAREVERGAVEVHAYAVLTNHCHLLVRARHKEISGALRRVFGDYSRQLNRRLRRGGPIFGGRARVNTIRGGRHWRATIAYIDRNPVDAGIARTASGYPFGSAWHYVRGSTPPWLTRASIEAFVRSEAGAEVFRPADYTRMFGDTAVPEGSRTVVANRLRRPDCAHDPLDDLLASSPADVRRWLERMAEQADGLAAGPALVVPDTLLACLKQLRGGQQAWPLFPRGLESPLLRANRRRTHRGGVRRDGWSVLACGLLRLACRLTLEEVGCRVGLSVAGVHLQVACHRRLVLTDGFYRARAERVLSAALRADFPDGAPPGAPAASWSE
jgi:REP element-mobilizing transposase RayT